MAIKVNGDIVISNTREMTVNNCIDFTPAHWSPEPNTITNNIDMGLNVMHGALTADTTFSISGTTGREGTTAFVVLDLTTSAHTPTWPNNIEWAENTEPTWSDYRYWAITMSQVANTEIRAAGVGFVDNVTTPTEAIALSGTTSTPVTFFDSAASNANDMVMGWTFGSDGNIYKYESVYNVGGQGTYLHSSTQWNNITPSKTYYIRVSNYADNTVSVPDSDSLNEWIPINTDREWRWRDARDPSQYADVSGTIKVEIAERTFGSGQHSTSSPRYYSAQVGYIDGEGFNETLHSAYWNDTLVYNGGIASTTSPGDVFLGTDGNYYLTGSLQQTTGSPPTYSYNISQASFNILATGYYECTWSGTL
jgi:hypothetical protein